MLFPLVFTEGLLPLENSRIIWQVCLKMFMTVLKTSHLWNIVCAGAWGMAASIFPGSSSTVLSADFGTSTFYVEKQMGEKALLRGPNTFLAQRYFKHKSARRPQEVSGSKFSQATDSALVSQAVQMQKWSWRRSRGSGTTPATAESHQMAPVWKFSEQRKRAKSSMPGKAPTCLELITIFFRTKVARWASESSLNEWQEKQSQDNTRVLEQDVCLCHCRALFQSTVTPAEEGSEPRKHHGTARSCHPDLRTGCTCAPDCFPIGSEGSSA